MLSHLSSSSSRAAIHWPQVTNVTLCILLLIFSLSFVSFNVFTVPVEQHAPSLTSVWSRALGFASVFDCVGTLLTVVYLNASKRSTICNDTAMLLTRRTRLATLPVSTCYLLLCLCRIALNEASQWWVYAGVVTQGVPYAYFYLVAVEALSCWMPSYPVLAMTMVSASYCVSQVVVSHAVYKLIATLGVVNALTVTSVVLFVACSTCGLLLRFPTERDERALSPATTTESTAYLLPPRCGSPQHAATAAEEEEEGTVQAWHELLKRGTFYRYIAVVFLGRTCVGVYNYYFKLGYVYNIATPDVVTLFQLLALCTLAWTLIANSAMEYIQLRTGKRATVTRVVLIVVYTTQALLLLWLAGLSRAWDNGRSKEEEEEGGGMVAMILISVVVGLFESQTAYAVSLARTLFGERNGTTAFGISVGLAMSPGDAAFTTLVALTETRLSVNGTAVTPGTFCLFYVIGSGCLLLGGVLVAL